MKKKVFALLVALCMLFAVVPATTHAATTGYTPWTSDITGGVLVDNTSTEEGTAGIYFAVSDLPADVRVTVALYSGNQQLTSKSIMSGEGGSLEGMFYTVGTDESWTGNEWIPYVDVVPTRIHLAVSGFDQANCELSISAEEWSSFVGVALKKPTFTGGTAFENSADGTAGISFKLGNISAGAELTVALYSGVQKLTTKSLITAEGGDLDCVFYTQGEDTVWTQDAWVAQDDVVPTQATLTINGKYSYICNVSVAENAWIALPGTAEHQHDLSEDWGVSGKEHWHVCSGCDEQVDLARHSYGDWSVTKEATTNSVGSKERVCSVCEYKDVREIPFLEGENVHVHEVVEGWKSDADQHWNTCSGCEEKLNAADHIFGEWIVTKEATLYDFGTQERTCTVCEHTDLWIIPMLSNHTHTAREGFEMDANKHWIVCATTECGKILNTADHTFGDWIITEDGNKARVCSVCEYTETETDEPSTEEPSTEEPATEEPTTEEPTTEEPSTEEPSTEEPSTEESSTEEPSTEEPSTEEPSTEEPSTEEPSTEEPSTKEPSTEEPTTEEPTTEDPTTEMVPDTPDTGDNGWLGMWSLVAMFSMIAITGLNIIKIKRSVRK